MLNLTYKHVIKHAFIINHVSNEVNIIIKFINNLKRK